MIKATYKTPNAIWTLTYTINEDQSVFIHNFDSQDNDGYMFAANLGTVDYIQESEGRVADKVSINGTVHDISNKQQIFSYKLPL